MSEQNATQARCARHGEYAILFKRPLVLADDGTIPLAGNPPPPPARAYQPQAAYPEQAAYPQQLSYAGPAQYAPPYAAVRSVGPCQNHPQVPARHYCSHCSARICSVCDFTFPGNIHFCPRCIMTNSGTLSPGRKNMMIAAYCMAGATTALVAMAVAAGAAGSLDEGDVIIFAILAFVMIGCVVVGTGLGFGAIDRKLSNPVSLWIAALWNGIMTLALVVMMVIGILTRGG